MVSTTFNLTRWHLSRSFISPCCCWTLAVDLLSSTVVLYRPIGRRPRLVLHVGLRLVFFGGDGVWAQCHSNVNLAKPRLAWLVFCWRRPFVLFNKDKTFSCAIPLKKKKNPIFADLFRPVGGGFVRTPRTPYSYAPGQGRSTTRRSTVVDLHRKEIDGTVRAFQNLAFDPMFELYFSLQFAFEHFRNSSLEFSPFSVSW